MTWKLMAAVGFVGLVLGFTWTLAEGQPTDRKSTSTASSPIQAQRCRMTLFKDQAVACGRAGVLEFVGRQVEAGKDDKGKPKFEIIELNEGDEVRAGEIIAQLLDDVAAASYETAKQEAANDIEIRFQKKAAEVAKAAHESAIQANRRLPGTYPEIEVKRLQLDAEKGGLAIEQADHQFKITQMKADESAANLDTYSIRAPFDGVITHVLKSKGEAVREGDAIVEMANTQRVRVEGYVDPRYASRLKKGMKVLVQQEIGEVLESRSFEGKVLFVDVQLEKVTQMQRIVAEVQNPDNGLVAGRQATMTFVTDETASK